MFKGKIGENFSKSQKDRIKLSNFSLIPSDSELKGKDERMEKFRKKYLVAIAKRLYADGKLPLDEGTFVDTVTNPDSMHFLREMSWIHEFLTKRPDRKWNAIPIGFQIFELGVETSPDKSEPMSFKDLLKKFSYGLTTVGPNFTLEEKQNYLQLRGKKLNFLCPLFMLKMVDLMIQTIPGRELDWFFDSITFKVKQFLTQPKKKPFVKKVEKKVEHKVTTEKKKEFVPKDTCSGKFNKQKNKFGNEFNPEEEGGTWNEIKDLHIGTQTESPEVKQAEEPVNMQEVKKPAVELDAEGKEVHYAPTEEELQQMKEEIEAKKSCAEKSPNK